MELMFLRLLCFPYVVMYFEDLFLVEALGHLWPFVSSFNLDTLCRPPQASGSSPSIAFGSALSFGLSLWPSQQNVQRTLVAKRATKTKAPFCGFQRRTPNLIPPNPFVDFIKAKWPPKNRTRTAARRRRSDRKESLRLFLLGSCSTRLTKKPTAKSSMAAWMNCVSWFLVPERQA